MASKADDIKRIAGRMRRSNGYGLMVDGVHTFDVRQMGDDMRTLLAAVRGADKFRADLVEKVIKAVKAEQLPLPRNPFLHDRTYNTGVKNAILAIKRVAAESAKGE